MPPRTSEDEATKRNPGQTDSNRRFNRIANTEKSGTFDDSIDNNSSASIDDPQNDSNISKVKDQEESSQSGGWIDKYSNKYNDTQKNQLGSINRVHFLRRKGPIAFIVALLLGGGVGFSVLFSPSLLIVQMKEVMVEKFDTQLASMDARSSRLLSLKIDGTTSGVCGSIVNIRCKYSTMSDAQVQKFKAAGIEVEPSNTGNRIKPTNFKFNGKDIPASDFNKTLASDENFRTAVRNVYNPEYAGVSDSIWSRFAEKIGIKKTPNITGDTDAARTTNLNEETKNGASNLDTGKVTTNTKDANGNNYTQAEADAINNQASALLADANNTPNPGGAAVAAVESDLNNSTGTLSKLNGVLGITGLADIPCQAYNLVSTLGLAAKTVRAVQLARYAMVLLNTADMIKAGKAKPEDVAYMGMILTSIAVDATGASRGSATDSAGYNFAANGSWGKTTDYTARFLAGGGLTGSLINVTSAIKNALPAGVTACKVLGNPLVQGVSLVGGIAMLFVPFAGEAKVAEVSTSALATSLKAMGKDLVKGAAIGAAVAAIPGLIKDIIAGKVTDGIVGADAGDAIASGSGGLMGGLANFGGNGPMTKADALAYNNLQTQTLASYTNDQVASLSPLDATNRHTFLGSIVSSLLPYYAQFSSLSGSLSSVASIVSGSLSSLIPKSSALSTDQYKQSMEVCQDYDYQALGVATDPFCNVIYGIPPKYLNKDPLTVIDDLTNYKDPSTGQVSSVIDPITGDPVGVYKTFVSDCIERSVPLGSEGDVTGKDCIINDSNADFYLHYVDQRVNNGMGDDTTTQTAGTTVTATSTIDTANIYNDSTGIACAPGTTDAGITQGYNGGVATPIRLCDIPNTSVSGKTTPIQVNSRVSGAFLGLINNYMSDTHSSKLTVADSFRSMAEQQAAWAKYGAPRAAKPGYSNHQMGLAIDFQLSTGNNGASKPKGTDAMYDWLTANASKYGIGQISSEAWHWQPIGIR